MKEKFRDWKKQKRIRINYVDALGQKGIWEAASSELLFRVTNIVNDFQKENITLTARQLYYQLVGRNWIPNAEAVYKRICSFVVDAKYAGLIDWDAIEDRARSVTMPSEWDNVQGLIQSAIHSYRLPRWQDQEYYVELFTEKQAMESVLQPIANSHHIHFGANKGYSSSTMMYELAQRLKEQIEKGKKARVLYFGDMDPSGTDMVRDMIDRLNEFLYSGTESIDYVEGQFEMVPLGLNIEQVRKYKLPPNPAKITDSRAEGYIKKYGRQSWELDALDPKVVRELAFMGIDKYLDRDRYDAWIEKEAEQKAELIKLGKRIDEDGESNGTEDRED